MPGKSLDRLMFVQGGLCFFCEQPLSKGEASVEHLLASANGGSNNDDNCVACCKAVNRLLGSMSLKEKMRVVLKQKGSFKCPNGAGAPGTSAQERTPVSVMPDNEKLSLVLANLKQRGNAKPRSLKTLTSTVAALFPKDMSRAELNALIKALQSTGKVSVKEDKIIYAL